MKENGWREKREARLGVGIWAVPATDRMDEKNPREKNNKGPGGAQPSLRIGLEAADSARFATPKIINERRNRNRRRVSFGCK